jgi:hypothetical protein
MKSEKHKKKEMFNSQMFQEDTGNVRQNRSAKLIISVERVINTCVLNM